MAHNLTMTPFSFISYNPNEIIIGMVLGIFVERMIIRLFKFLYK